MSGEDYNFHFSGRVRDGKLHFRLHMEYEGDDPALAAPRSRRTIDFVCAPRCIAKFAALPYLSQVRWMIPRSLRHARLAVFEACQMGGNEVVLGRRPCRACGAPSTLCARPSALPGAREAC